MSLAEKIAVTHKPKSFVIVQTPDSKWLVTLRDLRGMDDNPLRIQELVGKDTLEDALEAFIINPLG
jgi:hypothetical protein